MGSWGSTKPGKIIIEIEKALLDDLNISKAFSILDASVKEINKKNEIEKKYIKEAIEFLGEIVGIFIARDDLASSKNKKNLNLNEINILIKKRNEARKNKDYKLSDEMRNKLLTMGVEIEDHPEGTKWKEI